MKILRYKYEGSEIDLLQFFCPGCKTVHHVNSGWEFNGDFEKPTITPSIGVNLRDDMRDLTEPKCHSYITRGKIKFLADSTHELAGQTVDLPDHNKQF